MDPLPQFTPVPAGEGSLKKTQTVLNVQCPAPSPPCPDLPYTLSAIPFLLPEGWEDPTLTDIHRIFDSVARNSQSPPPSPLPPEDPKPVPPPPPVSGVAVTEPQLDTLSTTASPLMHYCIQVSSQMSSPSFKCHPPSLLPWEPRMWCLQWTGFSHLHL